MKSKIHRPKVKQYRQVTLPSDLLQELKSIASTNTHLNRFLQIIYMIKEQGFKRDSFEIGGYKIMSSSYLKGALGKNYATYIDKLIEAQIIASDGLCYTGKAFGYKVLDRFSGELITDKFSFFYTFETVEEKREIMEYREEFIKDFRKLDIPFIKLYKEAQRIIDGISTADLPQMEDCSYGGIREVVLYEDGNRTPVKITYRDALITADAKGLTLFKYKKKFVIADLEEYEEKMKEDKLESLINSIEALKLEDTLYAHRNTTNNRLDTNFTTMDSRLFNIIVEHNELTQIDLKNSQFTILNHILKMNGVEDKRFEAKVVGGTLYDDLSNEIGISRKEAKQMMFYVAFSGADAGGKQKKRFNEAYPEIGKFIDDYKRANGDNSFSVMLQRAESTIFIDNIYMSLKELDITTFTKHDSVIIPKEHLSQALTTIKEVFQMIGLKGTLSVNDEKAVKIAA